MTSPRPASRLLAAAALALAAAGCGGGTTAEPPPLPDPCAVRSPGAQWLAFSSKRTGTYDLFAVRADGSCLHARTGGPGDDLYVTGSSAGTLAWMSARSGLMTLYTQPLDGSPATGLPVTAVAVGARAATSPAYAPDGRRLAFEGSPAGAGGATDVFVLDPADGQPRTLTTSQGFNAGPAWSPDGRTLYFVSNRTGRYDVWKVPAAGGLEEQVTVASGILGRPAVSPDGAALAYARPAAGAAFTEVVIRDLASGAIRVVSSRQDAEPAFDRTGTRLVVTSSRGGNPDLWLLDAATGAALGQLTTSASIDGAAAFLPFP